jgi:hypothetical protein
MEAYCKAVRAHEDKFYGIELKHVPRLYNEADELAKIASGRITAPPPERFCPRYCPAISYPRASPLEPRGTLGGSLESGRRGAHG